MDELDMHPRFFQAAMRLKKRWNGLILSLLVEQERSYPEMKEFLPIPGRLIAEHLLFLESSGFITRQEVEAGKEEPVFCLTEEGRALLPLLKEL